MPHFENKRVDVTELMKTSDYHNGKKDIAKLGAGDSYYLSGFLKKERHELFSKVIEETKFTQMFNISKDSAEAIPRLVSSQAERLESGAIAIYRMPGCNEKNIESTDFTPTVKYICEQAKQEIGLNFNHVTLKLFRDQDDSLAFHKDKLLDLDETSVILSVSLGEPRLILFYSLDGKQRQTIMLQPGSLLAIGPKTNKQFMHAIPKLTEMVGPRMSLSLRVVKTYIEYQNQDQFKITGQGSEFQTPNYPFTTSHDDPSHYSQGTKDKISNH